MAGTGADGDGREAGVGPGKARAGRAGLPATISLCPILLLLLSLKTHADSAVSASPRGSVSCYTILSDLLKSPAC